ncbi:MAG TPA: flagellar biosynthetic protein FliR [Gallionella sp.]|nr:MAG: flagellar biosynthetic protein FliR [Gallionellales bacterium GWA2_54_124]OGT19868.1 MAG: flagellar biosynthetic protein FliR [Gallionellales bacterium RIFOXYD12_FULL_53_10]HCI53384.1 flagellar biosynthetic protein FliR [Gallionella sp.]
MLSVTSAQLDLWLSTLLYPMVRLLAMISSAPILGNKQVPARVKIGLSVLMAIVIAPTLAPMPAIPLGSPQSLLIMVQQIIIGVSMGFTMRIVFTSVEMAGEFSGLQMGLGFASFYNPQSASSSTVTAQFMGIIATLAFLSMNGHLMLLALVTESFHTLPVGQMMVTKSFYTAAQWGATIFAYGLQLSMPLLAALLITNLALGIMTRAAQQLNPFAIGFPITLTVGFFVLSLSLPYLAPMLDRMATEGLATALKLVKLPLP